MRLTRGFRKKPGIAQLRGSDRLARSTIIDSDSPETKTCAPASASPPRLDRSALVCIIFFTVSGGAFGLEPLVGAIGPGWAVVLVLATPLLWGLPIALVVAELSGALPEEGGY